MSRAPGCLQMLGLFADILDYPAPGLVQKATACETLAGTAIPEATSLLHGFRSFVETTPLGRLEEIYSGFFDLNPLCHPYVGYQLFGENYKRSSFLLALKQRYRAAAFQPGSTSEMPDRLAIVLRFIAHRRIDADTDDLVREGLIPALERMTTKPESSDSDHGDHVEFDGDTGVERRQLDGHSHGEVLAGGFVLEAGSEDEGAGSGARRPHPYHQALEALRVVLCRTWRG
ncbi:MAG: molecular chaperone TorD family protein [Gammaproteobacteria bacterium]|nr:molecular chaperone TorD family protein [Gammaproteobacteria bacterium]